MSVFDVWSRYISDVLSAESELAGAFLTHNGEKGSAREALVRQVLNRFLPSQYEVGTGEIVDHLGRRSKQVDIVVARRDMPALLLPSGAKVYLLESVLATIEVKSELNSATLVEGLDNVASVADLSPNLVSGGLARIAEMRGIRQVSPGNWAHTNPLETALFDLLPRPPGYVFGFSGYSDRIADFVRAIETWGAARQRLALRYFPAVIVGQGCFAWRNAPPYQTSANHCLLIARERTPLRLLVLHLLYSLARKLPVTPDADGLTPNLDVYLSQMAPVPPPEFVLGSTVNIPQSSSI